MLISIFEEIKMLEEETFGEFYTKISDLRNSMVSLGKSVSDVKLIRKILKSLPKCFRIKMTSIEESKDLYKMKIEELVRSLQIYEYSLPPVKKAKTIALKASKKKARVSFDEDSDNEEDAVAMLAKNFGRLMTNSRRSSTKDWRSPLENLSQKKLKKKTQEVPNVLNAQALGIVELTVGISSRVKGRPTMRLLVMSQKKKKKFLLKIRNF
jgi:hypothetical protein